MAGGTPVAGHVNIVSDTGEIIFPAAPTVGTLAITYQSARYSDTQILDALTDGLNLLWPEIWNPSVNTTQILVSPTQYEYPLQAIFQDPRVILRTVEFAPPSGIVRYFRTSLWRQVEDQVAPILVFKRIPPVASQVRLGYIQPFTALSQPPTQVMNLPVYYAISRLLMDQETMRGRSDDLPALTGESANPTGSAINTSSYWLNEFKEQLTKLSLSEPSRMQIMDRAVERLGLSEMWASRA